MSRYQDLLAFLGEGGASLAALAPRVAGALAEPSRDPDAERIIEGLAHLVAQADASVSASLSRVVDLGYALFFPELARTFPAIAVARLESSRPLTLPRGTRLSARSPDRYGPLGFVTLYDVDGGPQRVDKVRLESTSGRSVLELSLVGFDPHEALPDRLRLHLGSEPAQAFPLYQALVHHLGRAEWVDASGRSLGPCPELVARPLGLDPRLTLASAAEPTAADLGDPLGWALLRTWLCCPLALTFVDLEGARSSARRVGLPAGAARLRLHLDLELPRTLGLTPDGLWLDAVPVVNLYASDAEPVIVAPHTTRVDVRPRPGEEIERVRRVIAFGPRGRRRIPLVEQLGGRGEDEVAQAYVDVLARGRALYRLHLGRRAVPTYEETLSLEVLATNGPRAKFLRIGEPLEVASWSRAGVMRLAGGFIGPFSAPRGEEARRGLVRLLSVASSGLGSTDALRTLINTVHSAAIEVPSAARELALLDEALTALTADELPLAVDGAWIHAVRHRLRVDESAFASSGELALLGAVLHAVLGAQVGLNTTSVLELEEQQSRRVHRWSTRVAPAAAASAPAQPWAPAAQLAAQIQEELEQTAGPPPARLLSTDTPGALTDTPVLDGVFHDPTSLGFFDLLALFERLLERPVGRADDPRSDPFRLRPSPSLAFPTSDVLDVEARADDGRVLVTTGFAGLYGVSSPLPSTYVDHWSHAASERSGKRVLAFLDVLHHRLLGLIYRGDRHALASLLVPDEDLVTRLSSLAGSAPGTHGARAAPVLARWFVVRAKSVGVLEAALAERLGRAVEVEELSPRRVQIPTGQRPRLGARPNGDGVHTANVLGSSFVLGRGVVARSGVTVRTFARSPAELAAFSPGGALHAEAARLVSDFGHSTEPRLEVTLPEAAAPRPVIYGPRRGETRPTAVLGRTAWLGGTSSATKVVRVRL